MPQIALPLPVCVEGKPWRCSPVQLRDTMRVLRDNPGRFQYVLNVGTERSGHHRLPCLPAVRPVAMPRVGQSRPF